MRSVKFIRVSGLRNFVMFRLLRVKRTLILENIQMLRSSGRKSRAEIFRAKIFRVKIFRVKISARDGSRRRGRRDPRRVPRCVLPTRVRQRRRYRYLSLPMLGSISRPAAAAAARRAGASLLNSVLRCSWYLVTRCLSEIRAVRARWEEEAENEDVEERGEDSDAVTRLREARRRGCAGTLRRLGLFVVRCERPRLDSMRFARAHTAGG